MELGKASNRMHINVNVDLKLYQLYLVFIVSPELISERDYVITHSVRSVVCSMYIVCGILQN